jgi:hypothetical protein
LLEWIKGVDENGEPNMENMIVSYRIPTQSASSIGALIIVDFLPEMMGDIVVAPDAWTTINGSDWDIDKLFIARYIYEHFKTEDGRNGVRRVEFIRYSEQEGYKKPNKLHIPNREKLTEKHIAYLESMNEFSHALEYDLKRNSLEACKNFFLELMMTATASNTNIHQRMQPLDMVMSAGERVIKVLGINRDPSIRPGLGRVSPDLWLKTRADFIAGKKGVAPFALATTFNSLAQRSNLRIRSIGIIRYLGMNNLNVQLSEDMMAVLDYTSMMINAHVDFAKDPVWSLLNVNRHMYNTMLLLTLTGKGDKSLFFISSPILFDLVKA